MRKFVHSLLLVLIFLCFFAAPAFADFSASFLNGTALTVPNDCSIESSMQIEITTSLPVELGCIPETLIESHITVEPTVSGSGYNGRLFWDADSMIYGSPDNVHTLYISGLCDCSDYMWPPAGNYDLTLRVFASVRFIDNTSDLPIEKQSEDYYCGERTFSIRINSTELEILSVTAVPDTMTCEEVAAGAPISFRAVTNKETEVLFTAIGPAGEEYVLGYMPTTQQGSTHVADISWWDHPTLTPGKHTVIAEAMGETDIIRKSGTFDVTSDLKVISVAALPDRLLLTESDASTMVFCATTNGETEVTFKLQTPSNTVINIGSAHTTLSEGSEYFARLSWEGQLGLPEGEYTIIAEAGTSSQSDTFTIEFIDVDIIGLGDHSPEDKSLKSSDMAPSDKPQPCPDNRKGSSSGQSGVVEKLPSSPQGNIGAMMLGDPVNSSSGNLTLPEIDFTIKDSRSFAIARIYNSLDHKTGLFGRGWSSPLLVNLKTTDNSVVFTNSDGSKLLFNKLSSNFVAAKPTELKLEYNSDTEFYTLTHPTGASWIFNAKGQIQQMLRSCCGLGTSDGIVFSYDSADRLETVSMPSGKTISFAYNADNLIESITDSTGRTFSYSYDENKNLISYKDPLNRETTYAYDNSGFLTSYTAPGNKTTVITYSENRVASVKDPDGAQNFFNWDFDQKKLFLTDFVGVTHEYGFDENWRVNSYALPSSALKKDFSTANGRLTKIKDSLGQTDTYTYDENGFYKSHKDKLGNITTFEWHPQFHKLTKKTDALNRKWSYEWCSRGNLVKETDPAGKVTRYTYDSHNNKTSKTDALGHVTRYVYDSTGNYLLQSIDAMGGISSFSYDLRGNLVSSIDQLGRTTSYEYDLIDRLVKSTYPDKRFTRINYDEAGNIASRIDNLNRVTAYTYDANGRLLTTTRPDKTMLAHTYDASGRKISSTDAMGRVTAYEYDALGNMTKVIYPDMSYQTYTYDTEKRLIASTDELGNTSTYEYDPMGRMLAAIDPSGARIENQYDKIGRKISSKDALGRTTSYKYDVLDRVTKVIAPDSTTNASVYDAVGNLLISTNALNQRTTYLYDALNRQIKTTRPDKAKFTTRYDAVGQVISETDALGNSTTHKYDIAGRKISTTNAMKHTWRYVYDNSGRLVKSIDPLKGNATMQYDAMDRVISETDVLGRTATYEYDATGKRIAKTDSMGRRSIFNYDTRDRLTSEIDAEGRIVSYAYDAAGRKTTLIDGAGRVWRWEYDALGRITAEIDPIGNKIRSVYDTVGNLILRTNARGQATGYEYNIMNRLVKVSYPDQTSATFKYDVLGRELVKKGDAGEVEKAYDIVGNLISEKFVNQNKLWKYSFDMMGNKIKAVSPENEIFKYSYDKLYRVVKRDSEKASENITYVYDALGRTIEEKRSESTTANKFDAAGQLLEMKHYRLVLDQNPFGWGKNKNKKPVYKEEILALRQYAYDPAGNRISMTDEDGTITSYVYDNSNWLTRVVYPNTDVVTYTYNGAGDRTSEKLNNKPAVGYEYDAAGRMIAKGADTFIYDADGNMLSDSDTSYTWNSDNRLVKAEKRISRHDKDKKGNGFGLLKNQDSIIYEEYAYLPQDWRRITRKTGTLYPKSKGWLGLVQKLEEQTFASVYDGDDESHEYIATRAIFKLPGKSQTIKTRLKLLREFIGGPGADDIEHVRYGPFSLAMLKDGLGSTIALTGKDGKAIARIGYDAWGNLRWPDKDDRLPCKEDDFESYLNKLENIRSFGMASHNAWGFGKHFAGKLTPYLYTGRRYSEITNQYFNRNRYYSPALGRFTSKDPIGFNGGMNLYRYADNNPVLFIDPMGFITLSTQTEAEQVKAEIVNQGRNAKLIALLFAYWNPGDSFETTLFNDDWVKSMGFDVKNPDTAGYAADASGSRGKHYEKSPQIIKNAIDEMEASVILNASHLSRLVFQSEWFLNRYHGGAYNNEKFMMIWIINEFERTQKTIEILQSGLDTWEKCN
ncbi:MAG: DUF6531 domain-containing protein [Candidatus Riflebacteria bacterium]|nr:DUF6531 domain-containing protein [Candidatus Riflebacteria bacterium]